MFFFLFKIKIYKMMTNYIILICFILYACVLSDRREGAAAKFI